VSTFQVFEEAERVEFLFAAIYEALARRFSEDPETYALFARLHEEETQHARRVRLLAARYRHDPKLLGRIGPESRELRPLTQECEAVLAAVKDGAWGRDLEEVFGNLAALEERCSRAHAELISREGDPELRAFFAQLAEQDEAHRQVFARPAEDAEQKDRTKNRSPRA
jgi:rubrerythrin